MKTRPHRVADGRYQGSSWRNPGSSSCPPRHARQARETYRENRKASDHPGGHWITADENGRIAFAPTRPDGQPLVIGGQSVTFWEAATLGPMLDAFEAAINAGELDPQLTGPTPAGHSLPLERLVPASSL